MTHDDVIDKQSLLQRQFENVDQLKHALEAESAWVEKTVTDIY